MAGRSLFGRRGNDEPAPVAPPPAPAPAPPVSATPGTLRRERRTLNHIREERIRDLGGLALEMVRRGRFRQDLLFERCREVLALEQRIHAIDESLNRATAARRHGGPRCECGAPLTWTAHFCPNCGRPTGQTVVSCSRCGAPLPADARFCASCGSVADAAIGEQTAHGERLSEDGTPVDPWER
jgi:hypothetical protein